MTRHTLPGSLTWLARRIVPARHVGHVLAELEDDYARESMRRSRLQARVWLVRESASLLTAYACAPLARVGRSAPIVIRDLRLVARGLRRGPLAACGAMAMLSTGLVAVLVTAGLANALLFRRVSATYGDSVRRVAAVDREGRTILRLSFVELQAIRDHLSGAATVTAVNMQPVVLRTLGADVQTMAEVIDGDYFGMTGTTMALGRGLLSADDRPGAPPVAVIAEPLWRERFRASPAVLGQTIDLNGARYTIVGVAAALGSSSFLGASVDAWVPMAHADPILNRGWRTDVTHRWFTSYVLPASGVAEVEARLAAAAAHLARLHPDPWRDRRLQTAPGTVLSGSQRRTVTLLAAILSALAVLILATAASNIGGVFLARVATGRRQIAIHLSLGSGPGAIVRRQLLEGAILGLGGAALALALYAWARTALAEIALMPTLALRLTLPFDAAMAALVCGAGIVAGALLALGPALWASRLALADSLRDADARTSGGRSLTRLRRGLVSAQVALSLALIVGATLFGRSLTALVNADLGFDRQSLVALDFDLEPAGPPASELPILAREALARAGQTEGVIAAAMSNRAPVDSSTPGIDVRAGAGTGTLVSDVSFNLATSAYFETVGVPLVAGRAFTTAECDQGADLVVINQSLAARLWPSGDALERGIHFPAEAKTVRVVGIARDAKYRSISEAPRPHLYRPTPPTLGLTLLARTAADPRDVLKRLQTTLDGVGPGLVGFFPRTLDDHLAIELLPTRAAAAAATTLGTLALLLSGVGLYGLVAWFVALRRREIGIRLALGATAADVRRLVVRQAVATALPGVACGVVLAAGLAALARTALFGVEPLDPAAFVVGVLSLGVVVVAAAYLPSRRASGMDPVVALRE